MNIELDSNKIIINSGLDKHEIHPFWLRERVNEEAYFDQGTQQRLYDPTLLNSDIKIKESNKEEKNFTNQAQNIKTSFNEENLNQTKTNGLLLPSRSIISTSEFKVPPRGYVNLLGPKISLNLKAADSI